MRSKIKVIARRIITMPPKKYGFCKSSVVKYCFFARELCFLDFFAGINKSLQKKNIVVNTLIMLK
jgi:hypothetical protein